MPTNRNARALPASASGPPSPGGGWSGRKRRVAQWSRSAKNSGFGTGGFLINADRYIRASTDDYFKLSEKKQNFQRREAFYGMELVADVQRLALMNAMLHDIEGEILLGDTLGPGGAKLPKRT